MKWSVSLVAEGDRELALEEVVELADAVAAHDGVATGMGTMSYGAQILVAADTSEQAVELATTIFNEAAQRAGLPSWPIVSVETIGDEEEMDWYDEIPPGRGLGDEESD
jgi:hypothetical protein